MAFNYNKYKGAVTGSPLENSPVKACPSSPTRIFGAIAKGAQAAWKGWKGLSKTKKHGAYTTAGTGVQTALTGEDKAMQILNTAVDWGTFGLSTAWQKARSGGYLPGGEQKITPYNPNEKTNYPTRSTKLICNDNKCIR